MQECWKPTASYEGVDVHERGGDDNVNQMTGGGGASCLLVQVVWWVVCGVWWCGGWWVWWVVCGVGVVYGRGCNFFITTPIQTETCFWES